jgi:hypothetical protein
MNTFLKSREVRLQRIHAREIRRGRVPRHVSVPLRIDRDSRSLIKTIAAKCPQQIE